jgi:hypothetical protein
MATQSGATTPLQVCEPNFVDNTQPLPIARRRDCKLLEPLLVETPCTSSKASHRRRRSSVTLQLSPLVAFRSPTKAAEEAWERVKRSSAGSFIAAGLRINPDAVESAQASGKSLMASDTNMLGAEIMALAQAVYTQPLVRRWSVLEPIPNSSAVTDSYCRNKRIVAPKPKPAPTSPLPETPIFHVSPPSSGRCPLLGTIQAETVTVTEDSNNTEK